MFTLHGNRMDQSHGIALQDDPANIAPLGSFAHNLYRFVQHQIIELIVPAKMTFNTDVGLLHEPYRNPVAEHAVHGSARLGGHSVNYRWFLRKQRKEDRRNTFVGGAVVFDIAL